MASPLVLRVALWTGVAGFAASLAVHLATFVGLEPPGAAVLLHVGIFVAFVPVVFALKAWAEKQEGGFNTVGGQRKLQRDLYGLLPAWQKAGIAALMVYAAVNFFLGIAALPDGPEGGFSFRLFSGHWMFFYFVSAVLARLFLDLRQRDAAPAASPP